MSPNEDSPTGEGMSERGARKQPRRGLSGMEQVVLTEMERANRLWLLDTQRLQLQRRSLRSSTWLSLALWVLLAAGGVGLVVAWTAYRATFSGGNTYDAEAWGLAGDFIGGVTNPVLTFLSLIALVLTVKLQSDQLNVARDDHELERQRDEVDADREDQRQAHEKLVAEAQRSAAAAQARAARALERQVRLTALISSLESTRAGLTKLGNVLSKHEARNAAGNSTEQDQSAYLEAVDDWQAALEQQGRLVDEIKELTKQDETEPDDPPPQSEKG